MKNVLSIFLLMVLPLAATPVFSGAATPSSPLEKENPAEPGEELGTYTVCFYVFGKLICVAVVVESAFSSSDRIDVKSSLSRDGKSILLSGWPDKFKAESLRISKSQFSGYTYEGNKMYIQPGEYTISRGGVRLNLRKG